jgi:hypothetical protein
MNRVTQFRDIWYDHRPGRGKRFPVFSTKIHNQLSGPPSLQWASGLYLVGKVDGAWRWPLTSTYSRTYEWQDTYLYSLYMPSWRKQGLSYLGPFATLRIATISFISVSQSVSPPARNNAAPTRWIFNEFGIWGFFKNLCTCVFSVLCILWTLFLYCFVYVSLFLFVLSVLV